MHAELTGTAYSSKNAGLGTGELRQRSQSALVGEIPT
jgi:hypothetical protein